MIRHTLLGCIFLLAVASASVGQELPKPGPEHEKLLELVGDWDAVMDAGGQKSKAKVTYKSICNGLWLASDFQGEIAGAKFEGHGLDGYDQSKKKYVGLWVDSMTTTPLSSEGDVDPKTKLLVMTGVSQGPDGQPQKVRMTTETKDKDHFTFRMYMLPADGSQQLAFSIEYTRKKSK